MINYCKLLALILIEEFLTAFALMKNRWLIKIVHVGYNILNASFLTEDPVDVNGVLNFCVAAIIPTYS